MTEREQARNAARRVAMIRYCQEVRGSNPFGSTTKSAGQTPCGFLSWLSGTGARAHPRTSVATLPRNAHMRRGDCRRCSGRAVR